MTLADIEPIWADIESVGDRAQRRIVLFSVISAGAAPPPAEVREPQRSNVLRPRVSRASHASIDRERRRHEGPLDHAVVAGDGAPSGGLVVLAADITAAARGRAMSERPSDAGRAVHRSALDHAPDELIASAGRQRETGDEDRDAQRTSACLASRSAHPLRIEGSDGEVNTRDRGGSTVLRRTLDAWRRLDRSLPPRSSSCSRWHRAATAPAAVTRVPRTVTLPARHRPAAARQARSP